MSMRDTRVKIYQINFNKEGADEFYQIMLNAKFIDESLKDSFLKNEFKQYYYQVYEFKLEQFGSLALTGIFVNDTLSMIVQMIDQGTPANYHGRKISPTDIVQIGSDYYIFRDKSLKIKE